MIEVKLEAIPFGDESQRLGIDKLIIEETADYPEHSEKTNYVCHHTGGSFPVYDHIRRYGPWVLVKKCIELYINCPDPDKKEIFTCTLKTRLRMEKDIPRERWGWWIDTCPGQTLKLRRATDQDLKRCTLNENDTRTASDFMCEIGERGSLVSKEAIEYVQMPITTI